MCDGAFRVALVHLTIPPVNAVHIAPSSRLINRKSIWTDVEKGNFPSIFDVTTPFPFRDWRKIKYTPEFSRLWVSSEVLLRTR
jgi:hypothetical protein